MEAIKKQASKLREQVAKQQQAVLRQLGHLGNEAAMVSDAELKCHRQLQNLYTSTRAAKHFQKDTVRGTENFISTSKKQTEIARRLAEDCCKYGSENESSGTPLARAALQFGTSHKSMENERETMLGILGSQVVEPLRTSIKGAPLEDARHLAHCYDRLWQEVETQAAEVIRRQSKYKDRTTSAEGAIKLQNAERRLKELRSTMMALGKEAIAAMLSVEDQQQNITFQKLLTMVNAEKSYHQSILNVLDELHAVMILEKQLDGSESASLQREVHVPPAHDKTTRNGHGELPDENEDDKFFIAKVIHSFDAQAEGELSLSVDDYVVVREVASNGWSEGECMGKAGWFPSAYVERQYKAPASKITEANSSP